MKNKTKKEECKPVTTIFCVPDVFWINKSCKNIPLIIYLRNGSLN